MPTPATGDRQIFRWVWLLDDRLRQFTNVMAIIGIAFLILAVTVVVGDIVWRRIGGGSFIGAIDLTQFSVMAAVSWSIPYVFSVGGHVRVDLLSGWFNNAIKRVLDCIAYLIGAGMSGFLCWLSSKRGMEIWTYGDVSQDLAIPMIWFWAFLISGLAISTLVCLVRASRIAVDTGFGD
ncbi:MAG: TRAP transporter small permease [Pseudomonadota bacterium]